MNINVITSSKPKKIDLPEWLSSQLSPDELPKIEAGKKSDIRDFLTPEGQKIHGRIQLSETQIGTKIRFFETAQKKLEIPNEINGEKLTDEQKHALHTNKFIQLKTGNYLKIDRELNRLIIHSPKDLSLITQVGNYKLTPEDKLQLLNGESLTKVLKNENSSNYVLTTFSYDKNGDFKFDLNNTKVVEPQDYEKFNIKNLETEVNIKGVDKEKLLNEFLKGNDQVLPQIKQAIAEGYTPTIETLTKLTNDHADKRSNALLSVFNMDSKKMERLQEINATKEVFSSIDDTKYKVTGYNLSKGYLTLEGAKGERIDAPISSKLRTTEEQKVHLQSMSLGKSMHRGVGLGK